MSVFDAEHVLLVNWRIDVISSELISSGSAFLVAQDGAAMHNEVKSSGNVAKHSSTVSS